jgi:hypothetical protein
MSSLVSLLVSMNAPPALGGDGGVGTLGCGGVGGFGFAFVCFFNWGLDFNFFIFNFLVFDVFVFGFFVFDFFAILSSR